MKNKRSRVKRILSYSALGVAIVICAAGGWGFYEYNQLQPKKHFSPQRIPVVSKPPKTTSNPTLNVKPMAGTFNLLLIGSDARPGQTISHTDSMVLVHVNLNNHTYNMLSIPRDTRIHMPGVGYTKLTSVQLLAQAKEGTKPGVVTAVKAIGNLVGVPINYYAETDYWGLQDMVDVLGGINMDLPFPVTLTHAWYPQDSGKHFAAGNHYFDGQMVTEVVHERYSVPGTDYGRQQLQEAGLIGIAKAALRPENVTKWPQLAKASSKYFIATNMTTQDMLSFGVSVKGNFNPSSQVHYYQVKGTNRKMYNDALGAYDDEVLLNMNTLHQIIQDHFEG